jgi:hypothetical protein
MGGLTLAHTLESLRLEDGQPDLQSRKSEYVIRSSSLPRISVYVYKVREYYVLFLNKRFILCGLPR